MEILFFILIFLWFLRTVKYALFYLYLWQLKDYYIPRFLSHFETDQGKKLIFSRLLWAKIAIAAAYGFLLAFEDYYGGKPVLTGLVILIFLVYLAETIFTLKNVLKRELRRPKITAKSAVLLIVSLLLILGVFTEGMYHLDRYFAYVFVFLLFDIFTPVIISIIVLVFEPAIYFYKKVFIIGQAGKIRSGMKQLTVIGITGSYGKTSTKEFLAQILSQKFSTLKTDAHQNNELGVSRTIINDLKESHRIFVVEMGAYGKGAIKFLAGVVKPEIGIITGIGNQHLSLFGSQENIVAAKYELIESLPRNGLAVFNGDNKFCQELSAKTNIPKKIYKKESGSGGADIWAENIKIERSKLSFEACLKNGERIPLSLSILGGQNIGNILAAVIVARELGMTAEEIKKGAEGITEEMGGMKILRQAGSDPYFIDSTYSANLDGVMADLEYLKTWPGKKAVIMPCLIELGKDARGAHQKIGKKIGEVCDLAIITATECFGEIKTEAMKAGLKEDSIFQTADPGEISAKLDLFASPGSVVLLEGRIPQPVLSKIKLKK